MPSSKQLLRLGSLINAIARVSPHLAGRIAVKLFISPRRQPVRKPDRSFLKEAVPLWFEFKPKLAAYRWHSRKVSPKVLLLHGWESHSGRWMPLVRKLLAQDVQVLAFDGPASGRSKGKVIPFNHYVDAALAFERDHGPFDVYVGHSLGGGVAAQLARRVDPARRPQRMAIMAGFDESEHVFDRYQQMLGLSSIVRNAFDQRIQSLLQEGLTTRDYSNTSALSQLCGVEGLVLHCKHDEVSPLIEGQALHEAWKGSQLVVYENEGHKLKGEQVINDLVKFIKPMNISGSQ